MNGRANDGQADVEPYGQVGASSIFIPTPATENLQRHLIEKLTGSYPRRANALSHDDIHEIFVRTQGLVALIQPELVRVMAVGPVGESGTGKSGRLR